MACAVAQVSLRELNPEKDCFLKAEKAFLRYETINSINELIIRHQGDKFWLNQFAPSKYIDTIERAVGDLKNVGFPI